MADKGVFDVVERTTTAPATYADTTFGFLNTVAGVYWERVRNLVEDWYLRLCPVAKPHARARLRSRSNRQFNAAFWELYCHESLLRLGYQVICEPDLPGVSRRPDFLAENSTGRLMLESVVPADSDHEVAAARRQAEVFDSINQVRTANFFLDVELHEVGTSSPPTGRLRAMIEDWLASLDPDDVKATIERAGYPSSVPRLTWNEGGWLIDFRPLPVKPESRGKPGLRPIGMWSPGSAYVLDDTTPIRRAVKSKAGAYGQLKMPYVVATAPDSFSMDDSDVLNALLGHEQVTLVTGPDGRLEASPSRSSDGVWNGPHGWQNRRLSGVLVAKRIRPWTVGETVPTLWGHPDADFPLLLAGTPWRTATVAPTGELAYSEPSQSVRPFFDLSAEWPGPEPAWPS